MKVMKFGGTSVGSAERIKNVASLVTSSDEPVIVVLSAMSGTTDALLSIASDIRNGKSDDASEKIKSLAERYRITISELFESDVCSRKAARQAVDKYFDDLTGFVGNRDASEKNIVAFGELMSTTLMHVYLTMQGFKSALIPALDFMKTDADSQPDMKFIAGSLRGLLNDNDANVYITQGFICRNSQGDIDNLQRGGSDYSATIIGASIGATVIEIWTDIDGLHNNDPRYVADTRPVRQISFDQASLLARYGAKILHPTCVVPAREANIPVRLLNTLEPKAEGSYIFGEAPTRGLKAAAARDEADGSASVCVTAEFDNDVIRQGLEDALSAVEAIPLTDTDSNPDYCRIYKCADKITTLKTIQPWLNI